MCLLMINLTFLMKHYCIALLAFVDKPIYRDTYGAC